MAMTGAQRMTRYKDKKTAEAEARMSELAKEAGVLEQLNRFHDMRDDMELLAAEINRKVVQTLKARLLCRETARLLDILEDRDMRISFPQLTLT